MSSYALGVDLGTTFSAAAIARGTNAEPLQLGAEAAQIPSVVVLREDGEILVGDAAERRAGAEPARAAREFKRRLGDPVPIIIGGATQSVESLMGHMLREIVRRATEREGAPPSTVVLTHPANYSDYKRGALLEAARLAGLDPARVQLLTEPEAAAVAYSRQQTIAPGEIVAVYDFGGGTFDAALVRRTTERFELIGTPDGMERLGGIDFDQAVMAHVDQSLGGLVSGADRSDPNTVPGQARLRVECRRAKEALSNDSDTTIPVSLPGVQTAVRLTRDEFETMIRPRIADTVRALERAVASAGITMEQVSRVLLVGGTSRMPVVAEMVRTGTGRPVALDAHPKLAIATGAALVGAAAVPAAPIAPVTAMMPPVAEPAWQAPVRAPEPVLPTPAGKSRKGLVGLALGAVVGLAAVAGVLVFRGSDDEATPASSTVAGATTAVPTVAPSSTLGASTTTAEASSTTTAPAGRGVDGVVERFAFGGAAGTGIPGPAAGAGVAGVASLSVASTGDTYVATVDGAVLRISAGQVEQLAVLDPSAGTPGGIAVADDGTVYVTGSNGVWSVVAGTATLVVDGAAAGIGSTPGPIAVDGQGNVYFADNDNNRIIRYGTDASLNLVAGNGIAAAPGPIDGDGLQAQTVPLGTITGLVVDRTGRLLLGDDSLLAVRAITPDGVINTVAGGGATPLASGGDWAADGTPARDLALASIDGLAVDSGGRFFVADTDSGIIVQVGTDGTMAAVITRSSGGQPIDGVPARDSSIGTVSALGVEPSGGLIVNDTNVLRRITL
jgi:actin-like ATPase involved in cell morphogenesis/sugar lactone lactonase YvrE